MKLNKSVLLTAIFLLISLSCVFAEDVYGNITYAEGDSFTVIRDGRTRRFSVDDADVFGMEIMNGDIFQTADETMIELIVHDVGATIKVAENTSFRCDRNDETGHSSGELYYGRVRAKVTRITRGGNYRISSPSLVAGVRGTDFGLDVIALRKKKASSGDAVTGDQEFSTVQAESSVLHRVFCFEGSVLVGDFTGPELDTVLLEAGEKVERVVVASAPEDSKPLEKEKIESDITEFWNMRPFSAAAPEVVPEEQFADLVDTEDETDNSASLRVANIITASLITVGSLVVVSSAVLDSSSTDEWVPRAASMSGGIMIGTGLLVSIISRTR